MNDEIKIPTMKVSPLKKICMTIGELPSSYLETMTYYEMLIWFVNYLRDNIIPTVNNNAEATHELQELFVELQNYVNNYFDNLDIQEEINNKLDEMYENGTLEELFNKILNATNGTLVCNIEYRDCTEYIKNITDETQPIKGYIQGFTTTPTSFIIARQVGGSLEGRSNMIYLEEISKSTRETLKSAYLELFHANSLAYNHLEKEIYVATNSYVDENYELQPKNEIIIIDYDTFTIKETITPPTEITSNHRVRSVSYDNKNHVLALADSFDVWIMEDFETISNHITLDNEYTAPSVNPTNNYITNQNTVVYDNRIYSTRFWANGISIYDMSGRMIRNYYDFDYDIPVQMGELESIAIEDNGNVYLASTQLSVSNGDVCKLYDITIVKSNLKYNGYKNYFYSSILSNRIGFYVDSETTNKIQCGTSLLPFKSIEQAILACQFTTKNVSCSINLVGTDKQFGFIVAKNNIHIIINGNDNKVYAIQLQSQSAELNNVIVNNDVLVNVATETNPSNVLISNNSKVCFLNCKILNTGSKLTNAIYVSFSDLLCYELEVSNFTNVFRLLNSSKLKLKSANFTTCDYYYYNEANTQIENGDSPAVIQRQNPSSQIVDYYHSNQNVPYTFNNNIVTFNNPNYDNNRLFIFGVRVTLDDSSVHVKNVVTKARANNVDGIVIMKSGNIYNIAIEVYNQSQGNYQFYVKGTKTNVSTNTLTDVSSNISFNIRDVIAI